ncbi:MAG TPA: VOC family protein [Gammaproteobacteria bacterium]|jgi:uncharacterized glyoxalase superfamily protein PhnB|nr:VOC family protein [Gammaproteobacteria bacterium]
MVADSFSFPRADWLTYFDDSKLSSLALNWDSPTLLVSDVSKAINFYEQIFHFVPVFVLPDEHNQISFARMRYRGTFFTIINDHDTSGNDYSLSSGEICNTAFYLYVDNVDNVLSTALAHDALQIEAPHTDFMGDYRARLMDIFGYIWDIACKTS